MRMQAGRRGWLFLVILALCLIHGLSAVFAQEPACRAMVEEALRELSRNCAETPAGSACYGHDFIAATFREETDFFHPADQARAADLLTLRSSPANISTGDWGVAQVNLPVDLGEEAGVYDQTGLTLIALGQAELLHLRLGAEMSPVELTFRGEPHNAPCDEATNALILHSARGLLTKVILNGVQLDFDGSVIAQQPAVDIITFIVVEGELVSQEVYATAGQAMSILLDAEGVAQAYIPTREATAREHLLFGVVELATAAARGEWADGPERELAAEETEPTTEEATADEATAADEAAATAEGATTEAEEALAEEAASEATSEASEVAPTAAAAEADDGAAATVVCQQGQLVRHTIATGETLFAIAQAYNSSVSDIVTQNDIANANLIQIGQELLIPCDSRDPGETTMGFVLTEDAVGGDGACASLSLRTEFAGEGMRTFHWSTVSGATRYMVSLQLEGREIARYSSLGPGTSLTGALPSTTSEAAFAWLVTAWQDGELLCASAAVPLADEGGAAGDPLDPAPSGSVTFTWSCLSPGEIALDWSQVPAATERMTITYRDETGSRKQTLSVPGSQGRVILAETYTADGVITLSPQGISGTLSPVEIYCS
ncbi:MAG: LysM domain-containing protein [Anaerolineaceae bacterium]|nr:LysM domain-containing protein [Anaerolineaceae bacterium]